ncbi:MAG: hypothetical protein VX464_11660 [Pseudomonadota bacterium]|nr:hypothetical protein [Pseudomonadota bacterium]
MSAFSPATAVKSLLPYDSGSTKKLFAAAGGYISDVTSADPASPSVSGLSNDEWQHVNIGTSGGHFLWICNGADDPRHYNGSTWATPTLSGVTATTISNVALHKRRLMFTFNNSLSFGYLAVNTIAGAVSTFPLASLFRDGGELVAIGSWTRDGGDGADDLCCFFTSNGEVAVYSGTDPGDANNWSLVGVFKIGRPIGKRCVFRVGADLIVISEDGYLPLSKVLPSAGASPQVAVSDKISGAVKSRARSFKGTFGWQGVIYTKGGYGFVNVPRSTTGDFEQHVVNLNTGAWARFVGQNGYSWAVHDGNLYFGGPGFVYQADDGLSDNGAVIQTDGKTAFQYFGSRGVQKNFMTARPVLSSEGSLPVSFGFDTDFADDPATYDPSTVDAQGATWDVAEWDVASWADERALVQDWRVVGRHGYNIAFRVRTATTAQGVTWRGTDVRWKLTTGL